MEPSDAHAMEDDAATEAAFYAPMLAHNDVLRTAMRDVEAHVTRTDAAEERALDGIARLLADGDEDAAADDVLALYGRDTSAWLARTRGGHGDLGVFELGTVALGRFAARRRIGRDCTRDVWGAASPPLRTRAPTREVALDVIEALHATFREPRLLEALASGAADAANAALTRQLGVLADVGAWEFGAAAVGGGIVSRLPNDAPDYTALRVRTELVRWLLVWTQLADAFEILAPALRDARAADVAAGAADPWLAAIVREATTEPSDLYVRESEALVIELLAPPATAALYRRVHVAHKIAVKSMAQKLGVSAAFARVCARCVREYDVRRPPERAWRTAAEVRAEDAAAARAADAGRTRVRAPDDAATPWSIDVADERRRAEAMKALQTSRTQPPRPVASAAVAVPRAVAAAAAAAAVAAAAADAVDGAVPAWAARATEDAWFLQAWLTQLDRTLEAANGGVRGAARARYFVRAGDPDLLPHLLGRPVHTDIRATDLRRLPVLVYAMPGVVIVRCHACARATRHTSARSAVCQWVFEVRHCHRGLDEYQRPILE